jgi:hypothetical protein
MDGRNREYVGGIALKELRGSDPTRVIDIVARDDGAFQFFEDKALAGEDAGKWTPTFQSGLYDSIEAAEIAALAQLKLAG